MEKFQAKMKQEFEISDWQRMHYFLYREVQQHYEDISISQSMYVADLLKKFRMISCTSISTPTSFGEKLIK